MIEKKNFLEDETFHDGALRKENKKNLLAVARSSLTTRIKPSSIC
jgi:hypothetical protein